jgi:hypothetical protein
MSLKPSKQESNVTRQATQDAGNYLARLAQVIDLGLQPQNPYKGTEKPPVHMINVTYETVSDFCKDDKGEDMLDKPRWISEDFPLYSLNADKAKSTLRMKGIDPSNELEGDWGAALGWPCTVTVVHNVSKTATDDAGNPRVYANIGSVTPPMKGIEIPELVNEMVSFDLDVPDMKVFNGLPQFLQDKIKGNLNFAGSPLATLIGGPAAPAPADEPEVDAGGDEEEGEDSPY